TRQPCAFPAAELRTVEFGFDSGARAELVERWSALGIGAVRSVPSGAAIAVRSDPALGAQAYRLILRPGRAVIDSGDADGAFYAAMTLAQLPSHSADGWMVPCVTIEDRPALRWRILSDDVSRGPLPTMRYFEERIRTIAAFKMNGYSPYMEHVFIVPTDPLPAPLDGITPEQLRELAEYAMRFHVRLIPQQQTFAHMHGTLRVERYAGAAELPHGFLLAPNVALSSEYLGRVIAAELAAVPHPPFFHIGSDETATLGSGQTQAYVAQRGLAQAFADHVTAMNAAIAPSGSRIMLWDDAIQKDAAIMQLVPRNAVIANYHYDPDAPFDSYIRRVAAGGFNQMVAPGAHNWDEVFPAIDTALANERGFIDAGKRAAVLGAFQTVWHDDGETLYDATWYPVLYAAAAAWQNVADPAAFSADFPSAFFGVDDARYSRDVLALGSILRRLEAAPYDRTNALFWTDAFDAAAAARMMQVDLHGVRLDAETVESDLYFARPPLHGNAAKVMVLAARRYDALARKFQIGTEVRAMYADAVAHAGDANGPAMRDLFWCRYWMWELRDAYEELAPLYADAWRYENREGHLASNLERYHLAAQRAIRYADAFYRATYDGYVRDKKLPPFDSVIAP
ncbi:MAG: family 20 glycosylhydrolase, partial [Candidatus Eremiobacteraeota bacterium]|nr:family 20 glycosylhydrolase [Candidatus Eremiobacteraeota bacterium]